MTTLLLSDQYLFGVLHLTCRGFTNAILCLLRMPDQLKRHPAFNRFQTMFLCLFIPFARHYNPSIMIPVNGTIRYNHRFSLFQYAPTHMSYQINPVHRTEIIRSSEVLPRVPYTTRRSVSPVSSSCVSSALRIRTLQPSSSQCAHQRNPTRDPHTLSRLHQ